MNPQTDLSDTSEEALEVQLECLRRMSFDAIRRRHPEYSENEVRLKFIELSYGEALAEEIRSWQQGKQS